MKTTELQIPRITLIIIQKSGKKYWICPTIRKMRKMLSSSLKLKIRMGAIARLRVVYGKAETAQGKIETFENRAEATNLKDLCAVFEAFIDKDLWIPEKRR